MKNSMPRLLVAAAVSMLCLSTALGDGIEMTRDYHFSSGKRVTLRLSKEQITQLEAQRINKSRLYTADLNLTPEQTESIQSRTGMTVTKVKVFEQGWSDCSCFATNIASRFAHDRIEVSSSYLTDSIKLEARALAVKLMEKRRRHWWQFWKRSYRDDQEAFDSALEMLRKDGQHQ